MICADGTLMVTKNGDDLIRLIIGGILVMERACVGDFRQLLLHGPGRVIGTKDLCR